MSQGPAVKPQLSSTANAPVQAVLPEPARLSRQHPADYLPDPGLAAAIKVALTLRKPILVTGEPGTGKTHLAYHISWTLGYRNRNGEPREPLVYEAKSTSVAKDLFYTYNTLARFHAAHTGEGSRNTVDYITYNALGIAIVNANSKETIDKFVPPDFDYDGPSQSVVLIDEIDKAPRDFPNDLLNEIDSMYFKIQELGNIRLAAPANMHPVVVITSNSEKHLPAAFLRRCIYYNIPFPTANRLEEIIWARIRELADNDGPFVREAINLMLQLRDKDYGLQKKPATAELLDWLVYLVMSGANTALPLREQAELLRGSMSALIKGSQDQEISLVVLQKWLARK